MREPVIRRTAREKAARVTLLLLDVDGVLSDGRIIYDADGREIKAFYVRDGHGIFWPARRVAGADGRIFAAAA